VIIWFSIPGILEGQVLAIVFDQFKAAREAVMGIAVKVRNDNLDAAFNILDAANDEVPCVIQNIGM